MIKFRALALVDGHGEGQHDVLDQRIQLEDGKTFLAREDGHGSGSFAACRHIQNQTLIAVE